MRAFTHILSRITLAVCLFAASLPAYGMSLIRDAEIERILRIYSDPIFKQAGLPSSTINLYIVNDDAINAFVMGGTNIFINTGLLLAAEKPEMLISVIAHETGHIAGGHLVRTAGEMEQAQLRAMIGYLLGAAAMAGGAGEVGAAVMSANESMTMRGLYSFSRANEEAADQSALVYLDAMGVSASGMLDMFEVLRKLEYRKIGSNSDPYLRTHPLGKERVEHIRSHLQKSTIAQGKVPEGYAVLHERMLGKLEGFMQDPDSVLQKYAGQNNVRARYARAVAYHRLADTDKSLSEIDYLISQAPNDPYFHELKGQILFESGRVAEAAEAYKKAAKIRPNEPLIQSELGRALVATEDSAQLPAAIHHLEYSLNQDRRNPLAWRLLGTAYGRSHQMDLSHLALAEEAVLLGKSEQALQQLDQAEKHITTGSPSQLRLQDLRNQALDLRREKNKS